MISDLMKLYEIRKLPYYTLKKQCDKKFKLVVVTIP